MSDETSEPAAKHRPPTGSETHHELHLAAGNALRYRAHAEWLVLQKNEEPHAEMFHVAYLTQGGDHDGASRPLTFVFNGGPGAASAFLHIGAMGPKRVVFRDDGEPPPPPAELVDNAESWLSFTDLVFVDPIGTGYSRIIKDAGSQAPAAQQKPKCAAARGSEMPGDGEHGAQQTNEKEYYELSRDLESLCEFIQRFVTRHRRWRSPVYIAGESYGGFRVAKLARKLQQDHGIGLNGVILISPALELMSLEPSDYDVLGWIGQFPSLVASALFHNRTTGLPPGTSSAEALHQAERFAVGELAEWLIQGEALPLARQQELAERMEAWTGVARDVFLSASGRVPITRFARELLKGERRVCGVHDTTRTAIDPYPDRETHQAPDPGIWGLGRVFISGINALLGEVLGVACEREYRVLSMDINESWRIEDGRHAFERQVGATDDLRYAMALNPHMHVLVAHGLHDLVTPYYATERLLQLLKLQESQRASLHVRNFQGGHMFYLLESSRRAFRDFAGERYAVGRPRRA